MFILLLSIAMYASAARAWMTPPPPHRPPAPTTKPVVKPPLAAVTAALWTATIPLIPLVHAAVDATDDYEYGAVNAPIGLAVGGGLLAIGTALLPIALRGGEEAFEEIKDRDAGTFGKKNKDVLQGGKKKRY